MFQKSKGQSVFELVGENFTFFSVCVYQINLNYDSCEISQFTEFCTTVHPQSICDIHIVS